MGATPLDAWSRHIVGWAMAHELRTKLLLDALGMTITTRKPADIVHCSDQGSQYTALASAKSVLAAERVIS